MDRVSKVVLSCLCSQYHLVLPFSEAVIAAECFPEFHPATMVFGFGKKNFSKIDVKKVKVRKAAHKTIQQVFDENLEKFRFPFKLEDFTMLKEINRDQISRTYLALHTRSGMHFSVKAHLKINIRPTQYERLRSERMLLQGVESRFIQKLACAMQSSGYTFMVLQYVPEKSLSSFRSAYGFEEARMRFYAAQLVMALEYLHNLKILYRNMSLRNILVDANGYVKLTGLFLSKKLTESRTTTLVGAPGYFAPEMICGSLYGLKADWWQLGMTIFELYIGESIFEFLKSTFPREADPVQCYFDYVAKLKERNKKSWWPELIAATPELTELLEKLLTVDSAHRAGMLKVGISSVRMSKWFANFVTNWEGLNQQIVEPPFLPVMEPVDGSARIELFDLPNPESPSMFQNFLKN